MNSHVNRLFCFVFVLLILIYEVSSKYLLLETKGKDRKDYASNKMGRRKEIVIEGGWVWEGQGEPDCLPGFWPCKLPEVQVTEQSPYKYDNRKLRKLIHSK